MKKKKLRIRKPVMKWQTGAYQRSQTFKFELPPQFLMLCKLVNVAPEQMLTEFMDHLSFSSFRREGKDKARQALSEYFIAAGYGNGQYSEDELKCMFREMDAIGMLFPKDADAETIDAYAEWRASHQAYWFDKWQKLKTRHLEGSLL